MVIGGHTLARVMSVVLSLTACSPAAMADVNVALRSERPAVLAGETVRLRLILTADSDSPEAFASLKIILNWDPTQLHLLGEDRTGGVPLMSTGFPRRDPSNLNEADIPQDGDAVYVVFAELGNPVQVDLEGAFITTFLFQTLEPSPAAAVVIPVSDGVPPTLSVVYDGFIPNLHITGDLTGAQVPVFEHPTRLRLSLPEHPVRAGDRLTATIAMENLNGQEAAGFAAALAFDPAEIAFVSGVYTGAPFGQWPGPIQAYEGTLDLAAWASSPEQAPTASDATLALLTFEALQGGCISSLRFRDAWPGSQITDSSGVPIGPLVLVNPESVDPTECACPCELDATPGVDVFDLLAYLDLWFSAAPDAERTGQSPPQIDVFDLLAYLDCWFAPPAACP